MQIAPLIHASFIIQIHVYAAMLAAALGAFVLWRRKGTPLHRAIGRAWVVLMVIVAGSSFFIHTIRSWGPFSPIHLLSVGTIAALALGIWRVRAGDIAGHRAAMRLTYAGALGAAGFFTLLPGRLMSKVVFGADASAATVLLGMGGLVIIVAAVMVVLRRSGAAHRSTVPAE